MGHSMSDPAHGHYRTKEELEQQKKFDPIAAFQNYLINKGILNKDKIAEIEQRVAQQIEEATEFADESPEASIESVDEDILVK
jgi:pyruvate dehydrogenase E1 component alpha subunit